MSRHAARDGRLAGGSLTGALAYGALFSLGLPVLLGLWMWRLDALVRLPFWGTPGVGWALAGVGLALMATACVSLWADGRGLPMSPFPPERLVTRGVYACVADPLYVGAVLTTLGAAIAFRSPAGVWIVSPVLACSASAFVWGYEREATDARLGPLPAPWLRLPPDEDGPSRLRDWVSVVLIVGGLWVMTYEGVSRLGPSPGAWSTWIAWDWQLPVVPWTEAIYFAAYLLVLLAPAVAAPSQRVLRRVAIRGLGATAGITLFYLFVPLVAPAKHVPGDSIWTPLLLLERGTDQQAASLPSFHVVWACLASELYVAAWPRIRWVAVAFCLAIGVSCVTTGMHSVLDVVAGFAAYGIVIRGSHIWRGLCGIAGRVANSWREWRVGSVRVMSHGAYAAVGGAAGAGLAVFVAGSDQMWWIVGMTLGAELGAGMWAQVIEGSPQLLRPYGYFGAVVAVFVMTTVAAAMGKDPWLLLAAMAVGGCATQVFGRLRCLVQGCCHGRPVSADWGIRHTHPRSRVVRLSPFGGARLHPTALYSMLWTSLICVALVRLWLLALPLPFIGGVYLILVGLGRFVEEHYRGEPQTATIAGLRLYQWLAIAFVVGGAMLTAVSGAPAPAPQLPPALLWPVLVVVLLLTYAAYGVDFPRSNRRFSRLV